MLEGGRLRLEEGDCRKVMRRLAKEGVQVDMIFVDPPYHLGSIVKRFGGDNAKAAKSNGATGKYARESRGFMGKKWDSGNVAFQASTWKLAFNLLKPGGYIIAFSHVTTYHRLACAIEDAGFEVRDMLDWLYGQGSPKSHNMTDEFEGYGSAFKPAKEPACFGRKPLEGSMLDNMLAHGLGAINIDALRVPLNATDAREALREIQRAARDRTDGWRMNADGGPGVELTDKGRWPSNLVHDGSPEVVACFPAKAGQKSAVTGDEPSASTANIFNPFSGGRPASAPLDARGTAARFFRHFGFSNADDWCARVCYCPKAPNSQRVYRCSACGHRENFVMETCPACNRRLKPLAEGEKMDPETMAEVHNHPTVKPVDMLSYWIRGVCPPGGVILDPFAGTGSTGIAALREGRSAILIDSDPESIADIRFRVDHLSGGGTPLFGGGG